jgi:hypothetical protein
MSRAFGMMIFSLVFSNVSVLLFGAAEQQYVLWGDARKRQPFAAGDGNYHEIRRRANIGPDLGKVHSG